MSVRLILFQVCYLQKSTILFSFPVSNSSSFIHQILLLLAIVGVIVVFYLHEDKFQTFLGMFSSTLVSSSHPVKDDRFGFHPRSRPVRGEWNMYTSAATNANFISTVHLYWQQFQEFIKILTVNFARLWLMNTSIAELVLMTIFVLSIVYSFTPVDCTTDDEKKIYVGLNSDLIYNESALQVLRLSEPTGSNNKDIDAGTNYHVFSLENACLMMECSWYLIKNN